MLPRKLAYRDKFVKLLVQEIVNDCAGESIVFPDHDTKIKFVVEFSEAEFNTVFSALMTGADLSYPDNAHEVTWLLLKQLECPVSICEEMTECLSPLFDALETAIEALQQTVDEIQETQTENGLQPPVPVESLVDEETCGAAAAVVDFMNSQNEQFYLEAEDSLGDNILEVVPVLIELVPFLGELPFDELFEVANAYFANQVLDYQADFITVREDMINDLYCLVLANDNTFDIEVWGDWLVQLDVDYPTNRAASVFSRFAPVKLTFLNLVAALIQGKGTIEEYFKQVFNVFNAGKTDPQSYCGDCPILTREPVITADWIDFTDYGGTNIVDEGAGFWTITSTVIGSGGYVIEIQDINGLDFHISDVTYPDGIAACALWRIDTTNTVDCVDPVFTSEAVNRAGWTWGDINPSYRVTFKMQAVL